MVDQAASRKTSLLNAYQRDGFAVTEPLYSAAEIQAMLAVLEQAGSGSGNFRRTAELFAIRNLLTELPALRPLIWNERFTGLLNQLLPAPQYLIKAIYFDKPAGSNWVVAWHQDLMVAVDRRAELPGFGPWKVKPEGVTVQPPREYLASICTLRIHLDACDAGNGALRVVPGSHRQGVIAAADIADFTPAATFCPVPAGAVMLMKPLTLHASHRSTDERPRRVIHLEFSSQTLPGGLRWREAATLLNDAEPVHSTS
ncbi:phytanoyl-CoA dioxygenase family protein [Hymenobacter gummosus]|uniref:phytanoyl-CoA dioxygenase family protein n=1 Tax=Hymenobacter gummosus TaxID=1776032 RepID=UPI0014050A13|nr:phytanoyl-CoA dioxygenase family protein [Hymenobacter gummosus]